MTITQEHIVGTDNFCTRTRCTYVTAAAADGRVKPEKPVGAVGAGCAAGVTD
jgi:hypothetical protein